MAKVLVAFSWAQPVRILCSVHFCRIIIITNMHSHYHRMELRSGDTTEMAGGTMCNSEKNKKKKYNLKKIEID